MNRNKHFMGIFGFILRGLDFTVIKMGFFVNQGFSGFAKLFYATKQFLLLATEQSQLLFIRLPIVYLELVFTMVSDDQEVHQRIKPHAGKNDRDHGALETRLVRVEGNDPSGAAIFLRSSTGFEQLGHLLVCLVSNCPVDLDICYDQTVHNPSAGCLGFVCLATLWEEDGTGLVFRNRVDWFFEHYEADLALRNAGVKSC